MSMKMLNTQTVQKRPIEEVQDTRGSTLSSAKRHMSFQPFIKKPAQAALKKELEGSSSTSTNPNATRTPPQEPEIIDLSVEVMAKTITRPTNDFPRFNSGDVFIELGSLGIRSTYQLHSRTLSRASPWFDKTLTHPIKELDDEIAAHFMRRTGVSVRYEMIYNSGLNVPVLVKTTLTKFKSPIKIVPVIPRNIASDNRDPTSIDGVANVRSNIQNSAPNTATGIQLNVQSHTSYSLHSSTLLQTLQSAQAEAVKAETVTSETPKNDITGTSAQEDPSKTLAKGTPIELKAEKSKIKMEGDISKSEVVVKAEEPEIKEEQENDSFASKMQNNVLRNKESQVNLKENPASFEGNSNKIKESQVATRGKPAAVHATQTAIGKSQFAIKDNQVYAKETLTTGPSAELLDAYHNLFLVYYNKPPIIDGNDICAALRQAEILIRVAELYGSIPLVRPYLSHCVMQFGRDLCTAILQDPPPVIHIIGNFPDWPWSTVQLSDFPEDIRGRGGLFERKLDDLKSLQDGVDRTLFTSAIKIGGEEIPLDPTNKKTTNTWFVVQLWRDWFTRSITEARLSKTAKRGEGTIYRLLAKGGDAYLSLETVFNHIKAFCKPNRLLKGDRQEIEEDLKLMKDFAQKEVRPLCVNNSMLTVDEIGIDHLTCMNVETDDMPWLKKDRI